MNNVVPIGIYSSFPKNPILILGTVMGASELDAEPVNVTFPGMSSDTGRERSVIVCSAIEYHGQSHQVRIVGNLNSNRYVRDVLQPFISFIFSFF